MNNIVSLGNHNYLLLRGDGWFEILSPIEYAERRKPYFSHLSREVMGSVEIHAYAAQPRGSQTYQAIPLWSDVKLEPIPTPKPLIGTGGCILEDCEGDESVKVDVPTFIEVPKGSRKRRKKSEDDHD